MVADRRSSEQGHGYAAYSSDRCRCLAICRPAAKTYRREQRARRLIVLLGNLEHPSHGTRAAYDCGCRCIPCKEARRSAGVRNGEYVGSMY